MVLQDSSRPPQNSPRFPKIPLSDLYADASGGRAPRPPLVFCCFRFPPPPLLVGALRPPTHRDFNSPPPRECYRRDTAQGSLALGTLQFVAPYTIHSCSSIKDRQMAQHTGTTVNTLTDPSSVSSLNSHSSTESRPSVSPKSCIAESRDSSSEKRKRPQSSRVRLVEEQKRRPQRGVMMS